MRNLYPRLARINIKNHKKTYIPYILTCICTIMMFYIMIALASNESVGKMYGGDYLGVILSLGTMIIAIFAVIFLFYTASFLIRQRKKEFGLYNILGMEKGHISLIMCAETFYVALISLGIGIPGGMLLTKLMQLVLTRILQVPVIYGYEISPFAIGCTLALFAAIFGLSLLNTIRQIHVTKPVELLSGGQVGETEPRVKWLNVIIGLACLAGGYYIALTTESPLDAFVLFFVAVILVIIGTYCLFTAVSIAALKALRKRKSYYYQAKHFIPVSGMIHRMKRNAVGLANICILSTMVLVMLSGTLSLYLGSEDALRQRFPNQFAVKHYDEEPEHPEVIHALAAQQVAQAGGQITEETEYRYMSMAVNRVGDEFSGYMVNGIGSWSIMILVSAQQYDTLTGHTTQLSRDQVLLYCGDTKPLGDQLYLGDLTLNVTETLADSPLPGVSREVVSVYLLVVADEQVMADIAQIHPNAETMPSMYYHYGFDTDLDLDAQYTLHWDLSKAMNESSQVESSVYLTSYAEDSQSLYAMYGSLLFLGLFLGVLFVMATVLIIYYKQISEGYEDQARFAIMQKVGMSRQEIRRAIHSQVLLVFFLPLAVACIHIAAAFRIITQLLNVLYLSNVGLFAVTTLCTIGVFAVMYAVVYAITAREYYKIVR